MGRPKKTEEKPTTETFKSFSELETRLASVSIPNTGKTPVRETLMQQRVLAYKAHKNGYSKAQIAAAFKTSKQSVSQYISAVEMAIKTADLVRNPRA